MRKIFVKGRPAPEPAPEVKEPETPVPTGDPLLASARALSAAFQRGPSAPARTLDDAFAGWHGTRTGRTHSHDLSAPSLSVSNIALTLHNDMVRVRQEFRVDYVKEINGERTHMIGTAEYPREELIYGENSMQMSDSLRRVFDTLAEQMLLSSIDDLSTALRVLYERHMRRRG